MTTEQRIGDDLQTVPTQIEEPKTETSVKIKLLKYLIAWKKENPHAKFPSFSDIEKATNIKSNLISTVLSELENDPNVRKYGEIKRNYSQYSFNLTTPKKEEIKKIVSSAFIFRWSNISIFKIFIAIISIIRLFMALYYNSFGFDDVKRTLWSWISSIFFVTSAIIFFEAIILFWQMATKSHSGFYFLSYFFLLLWLIVITFNMINIMAGQRNSYTTRLVEKTKSDEITINNKIYTNLKEDIENLKNEIKITTDERQKWLDVTKDTWRKQVELTKYEKKLVILNNNLAKNKEEENKMLSTVQLNTRIDSSIIFSDYLAKVLNIQADKLQTILYLIRAILLDLITSIGFALILFLKETK
jgi:hypothetical protein